MFSLAPITLTLLVLNVAVHLLAVSGDVNFARLFALWPIGHGFKPWQLLTHSFLHTGWWHLFFTVLALWCCGSDLERACGPRRYAVLYGASVLGSAATVQIAAAITGPYGYALGASGGTFGLLLAIGFVYPEEEVQLIFPPITIKAKAFVALNVFLVLLFWFTGIQPGVAHWGHLGGMMGAYAVLRRWPPRWPRDDGNSTPQETTVSSTPPPPK